MNNKNICAMIDCSRNAVMNIKSIKKMIDILSLSGYNSLQLYTEDTFEVNNEKYFGYMRGRYTKQELKEIDAYANSKGIELIPCIETLAHLNGIFRWSEYSKINDIDNILLIDNKRTYTLIDNIFATISECFTSKKVNIGMDEAHRLGLGKYLDKNGYVNRFTLLQKHLGKVLDIAQKYGFQAMMWSDMFFKIINNGEYNCKNLEQIKKIKNKVPKNVDLLYFEYWNDDEKSYDIMLKAHRILNKNYWFASAAWGYLGFAPHNTFSLSSMKPAVKSCLKNGTNNFMLTMWGDAGAECSYFSLLPSIFTFSEYIRGNFDEDKIRHNFKDTFNENYDDFMMLDLPNRINGNNNLRSFANPSKYMLYNDLFNGIYDSTVCCDESNEYNNIAKKLNKIINKSQYGYIFEVERDLCKVLAIKYNLGVITRELYKKNDIDKLTCLLTKYNKLIKLIKKFYYSFKKEWYIENKTNGFDVQDQRIGGLLLRIESCRDRLKDYVQGKIENIEELENEILPCDTAEDFRKEKLKICQSWQNNISCNFM